MVTLQSLSALPPYSRKPGPYGPTMSICAKVMSRGVHNIAFSLSPDGFWAFDSVFFSTFLSLTWLVTPQGPWMGAKEGIKKDTKTKWPLGMWLTLGGG